MTDLHLLRPNRSRRLEFHHPVDVVRGLLAAALERIEPTGDAAAEICAVWLELEEPGTPSVGVDDDDQRVIPPEVILAMARDVLHAALVTLTADSGADPLLRAIDHLDAATAHLMDEGAPTGGAAW